MTLVQNLLRQLSGTKQYLFILLLAISLQSCNVFEDIFGGSKRPTPPPPVEETEEPESEPDDEIDDVVVIPEEPKDTIIKPGDPVLTKEQLNLAVILPFQLDEIDRTHQFARPAKNSFLIYKGIEYALNELSFSDKELNVYVFDNGKSDAKTQQILNTAPFPNVDAVIGPLYADNLKAVAKFAKDNKIPFISPLSSSTDISENNPYIINAVASKETRYNILLDYVDKEFIDPNVGIIYQPIAGEESDKNDILRIAKDKGITVTDKKSEGQEMFAVAKDLLQKGRENIIIVPANDNSESILYMDRLMMYLQDFALDYQINVVGLSEWNGVRRFSAAKYPDIKFHILDRYFVDETNSNDMSKLRSLQSKNNGLNLDIYTLQGYDIMTYLGELMKKHGDKFANKIAKTDFNGLQTRFDFDMYKQGNKDMLLENKYINILAYKNGTWQRIN